MLFNLNPITSSQVKFNDLDFGKVKDVCFADQLSRTRFAVVDTLPRLRLSQKVPAEFDSHIPVKTLMKN
mgnify:CR=1 FL=1